MRAVLQRLVSFTILATFVIPLPLAGQGRKLKKIERPAAQTAISNAPLPSDDMCRAAVYEAASRYGPREIESVLHPDFPYRDDLIEALRRADQRVTNVRLEVESIESTRVLPWQQATSADERAAARAIASAPSLQTVPSPRATAPAASPSTASGKVTRVSDCVANVRTRLVFDNSATGERTVKPAGRGEWRLRFAR